MKADTRDDVSGRLFNAINRTKAVSQGLYAMGRTLDDTAVDEASLVGFSEIADEVASELSAIEQTHVEQANRLHAAVLQVGGKALWQQVQTLAQGFASTDEVYAATAAVLAAEGGERSEAFRAEMLDHVRFVLGKMPANRVETAAHHLRAICPPEVTSDDIDTLLAEAQKHNRTPVVSGPVTASTVPEHYDFAGTSVVFVPRLRERLETIDRAITTALAAMMLAHGAQDMAEDVNTVPGLISTITKTDVMRAAVHQLNAAKEEMFVVLQHPDRAVLDVAAPTEEDWDCYRDQYVAAPGEDGGR